MAAWLCALRHQARRHPLLVLLLLIMGAAIFVVDDVKWQMRSVSMSVWSRYHEKFAPSPDLIDVRPEDKVILYWTPFFGGLEYNVGYGRKPFQNCPVSNCVTTNQRRHLRRADAVVFHPVEFSDVDLPQWRSPEQVWIFFMLESPPHTGGKFTEATRALFNLTVTYRQDSDIRQPYYVVEQIPDHDQLPPEVATPQATLPWGTSRTRLPWVVSHCKTPGKREQFVQELRKYIPVDIFGRCGPYKCSPPGGLLTPPAPGVCYRYLPQHYQFYLSLENSRCRDYITEKFFIALNSSLIPIVYGARREEYDAVAPPNSFIHTDDFDNPRELAGYIKHLMAHPVQLEAFTKWRRSWRVRGADRDSWCELCRRLNDGDVRASNHADINAWWKGPDHRGDICW